MITADAVKKLREQTGAGMMECKNALTDSSGDFEKAVDLLRQKGLAAAAKKAARIAAEGVIAVHVSGMTGVLVEVNSETDFVAKNDEFQKFAGDLWIFAKTTKIKSDTNIRMHSNDSNKLLYPELSYRITGLCYQVHNKLGRFCREK